MASRYCRITIESQFGDLPKLETKFESTKVLEITEQMALTIFQSIVKGIQNVYPHPIIRITCYFDW
jgi:hypothetical protein